MTHERVPDGSRFRRSATDGLDPNFSFQKNAVRLRILSGLVLVLHLGGCYSWKPLEQQPPVVPRDTWEGQSIRVTLEDGERIELTNSVLRDDSIFGYPEPDCRTSVAAGGRMVCPPGTPESRVALADVEVLEIRVSDTPDYVAAVGALVLAVGVWALICRDTPDESSIGFNPCRVLR